MASKKPEPNNKNRSHLRLNMLVVATICISVVIFAVLLVYFYLNGLNDALILIVALFVAYVFAVSGISVFFYLKKFSKGNTTPTTETEDFPLGILARLNQPAAVCNEDGEIVWMNKSFSSRHQRQILISDELEITSVLDFKASEFVGCSATVTEKPSELEPKTLFNFLIDHSCGVTVKGVRTFGGEFTMHAYPHVSASTTFFVIVLTEDTERNAWITKHNNNLTHIAYIAVDNLEEVAKSDQESYRNASGDVAAIIKDWSTEYGAFLKEYEREKYVAVITHKSLIEIEKRKFDLLERVSTVQIGGENIAVTVSIGVSSENGGLEEKDRAAQQALETALARGGNQAAVVGDSMKFYGAKAITSLKRSGVRHRVFADKLVNHIKKCSNVIIMGHRSPDFDAIGSCIGLSRLTRAFDKHTVIIANTEEPNVRECISLLSKIPEYEGMFISATTAQEMIAADTLVICSDVNNPDNFEAFNVAANADYLFIIDHHRQSEKTPSNCETLIVPSASSACELVSEILELELPENERLLPVEADIMFAGIQLDTKNFTRNTQVPTFGAAIYLRNNGADPNKAHALFKIDLDSFRTESAFSTDLEIYHDFIVIAKETGSESSPEKRITAAKTADRLLNIKNIKVSFVVTKMLSDVFISARSDGSVNVQLIMEMLKGGGHYNAAATMLKDITVDEAVTKLKEAITTYYGTEDAQPLVINKKAKKSSVTKKRNTSKK